MLEAIKLDDIAIRMSIEPDSDAEVKRLGRSRFEVDVDEFYTLTTTLTNRSTRPISPILRLQPHLADLPHTIALDLDKRFSWTGALQAKLPILAPGGEAKYELGIVALCSGKFEMGATVDEAEILEEEKATEGARQRSDTQRLLQGDVIGEPKLRSWVLKEACCVVARREE
jgi:hypothetical protein